MPLSVLRTDASHSGFLALVRRLDAELAERDGPDHAFYAQYNTVAPLRHAVVAFDGDVPVACGAFKRYSEDTMELKRMYTVPERRGEGAAGTVLRALERWAAEEGYVRAVLETGERQPEAIALYVKHGYVRIPNYGQYAGMKNSVCFEKSLTTLSHREP
ncbi:MAG: GNAT family N-acetyltransferase [Bacteroidetes bacterium]|nr:MAG: GNAT family N-acetyltransferase [Bacteroidota bacterium]